ncbi:MAG TPA: HAD hydrolase family protein [Myxococcales bacterium]|jgi:3-deoxy-D-manno-octulosonate 8-phosphate phosphatase (KDO 8-P phosphatase)
MTRSPDLEARAREVELLVLDVDGVLTDGGLYYGAEGEQLKRFDVKDGHGLVLAHLVGLRVAILTGRRSAIVEKRAAELWIAPVLQGHRDKRTGLAELLAQASVRAERAAYVGDDLNDLPAMSEVRLAACPADAVSEVRERCHFVAQAAGGRGAVREVLEMILKAQGKWAEAVAKMGQLPPKPPAGG